MRVVLSALVFSGALIAPDSVFAQWRVFTPSAASGRSGAVTAVVRELSDSLAFDEDATSFVIRCSAQQLEAFITTRDQIVSDMAGDVRVRVESDSMPASDARWQATKSNAGAFVPIAQLRDLIQRRMLHTATLRLIVPTQTRGRKEYVFTVSGLRSALDSLGHACPRDRATTLASPR
jgi:hypothetical protein